MRPKTPMPSSSGPQVHARLTLDVRDSERLHTVTHHGLHNGVLFVPSTQVPPVGSLVELRLVLPSPHGRLTARGRVVRTRPAIPGVEIQIDDAPILRASLLDVLAAVQA